SRLPLPVQVRLPAFWIAAAMFSVAAQGNGFWPLILIGLIANVAALLAKLSVPLIVAVVPALLLLAVMPAAGKVNVPPVLTVGVLVPPLLLKAIPFSALLPTRVSV